MDAMETYTVYFNPTDYPGRYVVRRFWLGIAPEPVADQDWFFVGDSLVAVRERVPPHCIRFNRYPDDEPQIVEWWV